MVKKHPVYKEVVCPFCSLLCDDLTLENRDGCLSVLENGCNKSRRYFEATPGRAEPLINGESASLEDALRKVAGLLKNARRPLISGMGCDVAGSRAAMLLAETAGAVIDHGQGDAAMRNILALQTNGWIMTTLTEVKNRADFILFLGTDAVSRYPRFFERTIWNDSSLFLDNNKTRDIAYIGNRLKTQAGTGSDGGRPLSINCRDEELIDYVALLIAMLRDYDLRPENISPRQRKKLEKLTKMIQASRYGVVVWSPADLDIPHAELLVQSICDLIRLLNHSGRFAGLALGGDNGGTSFTNVCTWQSGFPGRVDYSSGAPRYDPYNHSTDRLLDRSRADALLWIAAYPSQPPRPETDIPTIVLSCTPDSKAQVYIPVGTPGLDHAGNLFRTDSVVNLPLKQLREPTGPATAEILARITETLSS